MDDQKFIVLENFLPEEEYRDIRDLLLSSDLPWYHSDSVAYETEKGVDTHYYDVHTFYGSNGEDMHDGSILSPFYSKVIPVILRFKPEVLLRIKANCYHRTPTVEQHGMHTDFRIEHKSALLSVVDCDGGTVIEGHGVIPSKENRMIVMNGDTRHASTTASDVNRRVNISYNWI
jgi:hypothetical protein